MLLHLHLSIYRKGVAVRRELVDRLSMRRMAQLYNLRPRNDFSGRSRAKVLHGQ